MMSILNKQIKRSGLREKDTAKILELIRQMALIYDAKVKTYPESEYEGGEFYLFCSGKRGPFAREEWWEAIESLNG